MRRSILLIYLLLFGIQEAALEAQTPVIDSLRRAIHQSASDKVKLAAVQELAEQPINPDSLLPYVILAENIASRTKSVTDAELAAYTRAGYYVRKNVTDSALAIVDKLLPKVKLDPNRQAFYLRLLFFKAKIYDRANQFTKSLTQLVEVVQMAELLNDTIVQIQAKTGIGWVQMEMGQYEEALQWFYQAQNASSDKKFYKNYGALYSNTASAYNYLGKTDSAMYYINIAVKDARENNNLVFLATALSIQARILSGSSEPQLAEAPLNEVLEIRKKINDPFYIVFDMSNLASYYAKNNQTQKGIALCKEGIQIAKQSGLSSQLLTIYQALAENYKAAGNTLEYSNTLEYVIALKDSFNSLNASKQISEMIAASEAQKRRNQIMEQEWRLTKQNYWLFGSIVFIIMAGVIGWLVFSNYRRKQQLRMQLALEEEKRLSAQAVINAEEHERKRIAADLHDNLGAYAASIASNLEHLSFKNVTEQVALPLQELRTNSQAMVSQLGDTIWALKKDALSLTAISDRLKVFVQRIQPSYPTITVDVIEKIDTDFLLPPSQAFHLFQTSQEAIINALKHSGGKKISVTIESGTGWSIHISDNGRGMGQANASTGGGNGLVNMQNRAREGGWSINWISNESGGTTVIMAPTTN